ncbi:hypothetical protein LOC59_02300 [Arthrobacter sp. zg-Y916]|uniref:hypothetical protein n=1 Tax=Arthrobacter sp. zg-Y916 TaxID=2894190 RepID=UPI001E3DC0AB|nr:hypothetical protein [Arthrobacter sp. zg-Y916]MCC9192486.1 hypothetical protein [Arthrobacter sp. zg-Y916]
MSLIAAFSRNAVIAGTRRSGMAGSRQWALHEHDAVAEQSGDGEEHPLRQDPGMPESRSP